MIIIKTLYISDLDGTLLNQNSQLSDETTNIINNFISNGGYFTYATARSHNSASVITNKLNLNLPVITFNGAFIYDYSKKEYLHKVLFSDEQVKSLYNIAINKNCTPLVYTFVNGVEKVLWYDNPTLSDGARYYLSNRKNDKRMTPVSSIDESFCGDIFYITFIDDKEKVLPVYETANTIKDFNVLYQQELYRTEYWCEIMPKMASKSNALTLLKNMLGCNRVVAFGDSLNDIPMFNIADECYAVKNAKKELKEIATQVIDYNYNDSVALKIKELEY